MPLARRLSLPVLALVLALAGLGAALPAAPARAATDPVISVHGARLERDDAPWVPRGVQIVGLVAPDQALSGKYIDAHAHFGGAELRAAVADHADVVRFQVSQFGIDPDGQLYSPTYVREVQSAVQTARSLGLAVIVSLQAEPPAGEPTRCPLPDGGSERAWGTLAQMFGGDDGVMFELYNEPAVAPTATDWALWRDGGEVLYPHGQCAAVGMQTLIDDIRGPAPHNVIVVPGLAGEQTLGGMPPLVDPADRRDPQLAYGIHYPSLTKGITTWDHAFGDLVARVPVLVTEWLANSTTNCVPTAPAGAAELLGYLASRRIGIVGFAFDLPGTIVADWNYTPTSYSAFACGSPNGGPGQDLFGDYGAQAASGDGATLIAPPAWLVSASTLARLHTLAPGTTTRSLNTPRTFVTGATSATLAALGAPTAVPTRSFADADQLIAALQDGTLPAGTQAVAYAPGHTAATPAAQQRNPAYYERLAAQAAHADGLLFVAAPGLGLVAAIAPRTPRAGQPAEFLKLRIAAGAAKLSDAVQLPAQTTESDPAAFAAFTEAAAAQAGAAHPGAEILAGLQAGRPHGTATGITLFDAFLRTPEAVSGYGLGDAPGPAVTAGSDQALVFLRRLARLQRALPASPGATSPAAAANRRAPALSR